MIFIEINMKGAQHLLVNSGFIANKASDDSSNFVFTNPSHWAEIVNVLPKAINISPFKLPSVRSGGAFRAFLKTISEVIFYFFIFIFAKVKNQDIFILSAYPSTKIVIEFLSHAFKINTHLVHHGDLQGVVDLSKRYSKYIKSYFNRRNTPYLVDVFLSKSIAKNFFEISGFESPNWCVSLHPFPSAKNIQTAQYKERPCLGYFGGLARENSDRLQEMINALNDRVLNKGFQDFDFALICPNVASFDLGEIQCKFMVETSNPINHQEFSSYIREIDVVILPYHENQYNLIASGIVADCRMNSIKFWVARSDFFLDWLEEFPSDGRVFDSIADLIVFLKNYSNSDV